MKIVQYVFLSLVSLIFLWSYWYAGKIRLEPSTGTFIEQCPFEVNVMIDTEWVETTTVGISFFIDDTIFALNNFDSMWWVFPAYTPFVRGKARYWENKWKQTISIMGTTAQKKWFKWSGKFVTLKIIPLLGTKSFDIKFYDLWPNVLWDDSNINYISWDKVYDALTSIIWWSYNVIPWDCPLYEDPIPIPEDTPIILQTQSKKPFFLHQLPFLSKLGKWIFANLQYIIILILLILIMYFAFVKKDTKKAKQKR